MPMMVRRHSSGACAFHTTAACVVVAVGAQRSAQAGVVVFVPLAAGHAPTVRAVAGFAAGAAAGGPAVGRDDAGVDGAEGGGGEGGEHARMRGHRFRDAFAAGEPGADELVGVAAVGLGARRAHRCAAVPARDVDHPVRQGLGIQGADDLAGGGVDVADGAAQPDRPDAATAASGGGRARCGSRGGWRGRAVRHRGCRVPAPGSAASTSTGAKASAGTLIWPCPSPREGHMRQAGWGSA